MEQLLHACRGLLNAFEHIEERWTLFYLTPKSS